MPFQEKSCSTTSFFFLCVLFDTVGSTQRISAVHVESYLKAADDALRLGPDPFRSHEFDFMNSAFLNEFHEKPLNLGGNVTRKLDDPIALFADIDYLFQSNADGFPVRDIIREVVQSKLFRSQ